MGTINYSLHHILILTGVNQGHTANNALLRHSKVKMNTGHIFPMERSSCLYGPGSPTTQSTVPPYKPLNTKQRQN